MTAVMRLRPMAAFWAAGPTVLGPANLVEDLTGVNAFTHDKIASAVLAEHAPWSRAIAEALGGQVWRPETLAAAGDAHRHPPELRTHDRLGRRIDTVDFHPAYH